MTAKKKTDADEYLVLTAAERLPVIRETLRSRELDLYRTELAHIEATDDGAVNTRLESMREAVAKLRAEYERVSSEAA